jgi:hypothetical protein
MNAGATVDVRRVFICEEQGFHEKASEFVTSNGRGWRTGAGRHRARAMGHRWR